MANKVEIKEGPELDRAVAEAIGIRRKIMVGGSKPGCVGLFTTRSAVEVIEVGAEDVRCPVQECSTDLNAAFAAAEAVGLFSETFWHTLGMGEFGEDWCVYEQDGAVKRSLTHDQPTAALAICAAILTLKCIDPQTQA